MEKKLEAKNFTKPSSINLLGENKMPAPHIKRRRRLAKVEEATPAPAPKTENKPAPKAAVKKTEPEKKEVEAPKKVKRTYKKKDK